MLSRRETDGDIQTDDVCAASIRTRADTGEVTSLEVARALRKYGRWRTIAAAAARMVGVMPFAVLLRCLPVLRPYYGMVDAFVCATAAAVVVAVVGSVYIARIVRGLLAAEEPLAVGPLAESLMPGSNPMSSRALVASPRLRSKVLARMAQLLAVLTRDRAARLTEDHLNALAYLANQEWGHANQRFAEEVLWLFHRIRDGRILRLVEELARARSVNMDGGQLYSVAATIRDDIRSFANQHPDAMRLARPAPAPDGETTLLRPAPAGSHHDRDHLLVRPVGDGGRDADER